MRRQFDGPFCRKQRKLAKIWRAIARRWRDALRHDELRAIILSYHAGDPAGDDGE
jgi:hypothetical protein